MSDEQRVRTEAGWIGVEISRSRVRTPGKAGYGLYRVRMSCPDAAGSCRCGPEAEWTAYAFTLEVIGAAVRNSIGQGTPAGPMELRLVEAGAAVKTGAHGYAGMCVVPTRWTQAYRGRRDLGTLSLGEQPHDPVHCDEGGRPHLGPCVEPYVGFGASLTDASRTAACVAMGQRVLAALGDSDRFRIGMDQMLDRNYLRNRLSIEPSTVRSRQREQNAAFQAEHLERRAYGLERRHAEKLRRNDGRLERGCSSC